jgi:hypothetical protein
MSACAVKGDSISDSYNFFDCASKDFSSHVILFRHSRTDVSQIEIPPGIFSVAHHFPSRRAFAQANAISATRPGEFFAAPALVWVQFQPSSRCDLRATLTK